MNVIVAQHPLQDLDLDALTRDLLLTPTLIHDSVGEERSADESRRAPPKRTRKRSAAAARSESVAKNQPPQTQTIEAAKAKAKAAQAQPTTRTSTTSVELSELLATLGEAFDTVVGAVALTRDSSLKGRLILRMKRMFVMRAAERYVQTTSLCATIEDVCDEVLKESLRLNIVP